VKIKKKIKKKINMNTLNPFKQNILFNDNIHINSQYVKFIQFFTPLGQDFDFSSEKIRLDYNYDILENKKDIKDHIIILEFNISEINSDEEQDCILNLVVEGIYRIGETIEDDEEIKAAKHFGSLNLLISYLRIVLFNITSMTANGGIHLPLINTKELHLKKVSESKTKKSIKKVN